MKIFNFIPPKGFGVFHGEIERLALHAMHEEQIWIDHVMRCQLPEKIYRWAHSGIPYAMRKAQAYIESEGFQIDRHPNHICISKRGEWLCCMNTGRTYLPPL